MTDLKQTAIHEAGHAIAFYRLFGDAAQYGHTLTIEPHEDLLGSHQAEEMVFHGVGELTAEQRLAFENEAIYSCAGYAAVLAAGYSDEAALAGCESDFDKAERACDVRLDVSKEKAVELMTLPENASAVARVAGELLSQSTLEWDEVEILINIADGEATEQDYQRFLAMKRG